jgi:5-methylcytosine-specific restriction endonuclease McrA
MSNKIQHEKIEDNDEYSRFVSNYAAMLQTDSWRNRRKEILEKDEFRCTKCNVYSTISLGGQAYGKLILKGTLSNGKPLYDLESAENHISLHVHHTLYVIERMPWNYEDKELVTLCFSCHMKEHEDGVIPVYLREIDKIISLTPNIISCPRCGGDGHLPEYNFHQNGVCFGCMGKCFVRLKK